jgi:hypothetical protein
MSAAPNKKPVDPRSQCQNCGLPMNEHYAVNYSDGQMVAATVLLCPTSVFAKKS